MRDKARSFSPTMAQASSQTTTIKVVGLRSHFVVSTQKFARDRLKAKFWSCVDAGIASTPAASRRGFSKMASTARCAGHPSGCSLKRWRGRCSGPRTRAYHMAGTCRRKAASKRIAQTPWHPRI